MAKGKTQQESDSSSSDQSSSDIDPPPSDNSFNDALQWAQKSQTPTPTKPFFSYKLIGFILAVIILIIIIWVIVKYSSDSKESPNKELEGTKEENKEGNKEGDKNGSKEGNKDGAKEDLVKKDGTKNKTKGEIKDKTTIDQINNPKNQISAIGPQSGNSCNPGIPSNTSSDNSSKPAGLDPKILPSFFDDDPGEDYVFVYEEM